MTPTHDDDHALRVAIAADRARAVEAESIAAIDEFRRILTAPRAAGVPCPVCKVARPTPDEARSIGRVAEHLRGLAAEVEPSRMADGFEADRMRLLAHRLRQVAALMPDSDEARRLVEDLAGAQGAWVALLAAERRPCAGWVATEIGALVLRRSSGVGSHAVVHGLTWSTATAHGSAPTLEAAQLAAEDSLRAIAAEILRAVGS